MTKTSRNLSESLNLPDLNSSKKVMISLSGGLDSTVLVHALVKKYGAGNVVAISFNFGQNHTVELDKAKLTAERLGIDFKVIKIDYLGEITKGVSSLIKDSSIEIEFAQELNRDLNKEVSTYVPFRNLQFAAISASYAEANNCQYIFQGINRVDQYGYWDTTEAFKDALNNVLKLSNTDIQFVAPFVTFSKKDELLLSKELSEYFNFDVLEHTWSCYRGSLEEYQNKECGLVGRCNTCIEKITGYVEAGFSDDEILKQFAGDNDSLNSFRDSVRGKDE